MSSEDLEDIFRKTARKETIDGQLAHKQGIELLEKGADYCEDIEPDAINLKNRPASQLAESCEHFLKSPLIYNDFKVSPAILSDPNNNLQDRIELFIKSPRKIQEQIFIGEDARKTKDLQYGTSTLEKITGHDIYAFYQLQSPIFAALINHEFLVSDGEKSADWILYALLTSDIYDTESPTLYLPQTMLESLDKNKASFENFRYSSTHQDERAAADEDILFLKEMSGGLEQIMKSYYPIVNFDITESKLETNMGFKVDEYRMKESCKKTLRNLEAVPSYNLKNDFSIPEFEDFIKVLDSINNEPSLSVDDKRIFRSIYANLAIYFKDITIKHDFDLKFDEKMFKRIKAYCKVVMNSNLFDKNAEQLRNNSFFIKHQEEYKTKLTKLREESKKDLLNGITNLRINKENFKKNIGKGENFVINRNSIAGWMIIDEDHINKQNEKKEERDSNGYNELFEPIPSPSEIARRMTYEQELLDICNIFNLDINIYKDSINKAQLLKVIRICQQNGIKINDQNILIVIDLLNKNIDENQILNEFQKEKQIEKMINPDIGEVKHGEGLIGKFKAIIRDDCIIVKREGDHKSTLVIRGCDFNTICTTSLEDLIKNYDVKRILRKNFEDIIEEEFTNKTL